MKTGRGRSAAILALTAAATLTLASAAPAAVTYSPSSLSFGKKRVGKTSAAKEVVVRGSSCPDTIGPGGAIQPGSCPEVLDIAVSGAFKIASNTCPTVLPGSLAASQCTVSVAFKPTSRGSTKGFLRLQSSPSVVGVPLSGKGCKRQRTKSGKKKTVCREKKKK